MFRIQKYSKLAARRDEWSEVLLDLIRVDRGRLTSYSNTSTINTVHTVNLSYPDTPPDEQEEQQLQSIHQAYEAMCAEYTARKLTIRERTSMGLGDSGYTESYLFVGRIFL